METLQRMANRGSISTGFNIDNSLKVELGTGEVLYRDPTSGNRTTFTISFWFKRSQLDNFGADPYFMGQGSNARFHFAGDTLRWMWDGNSTELEASGRLRDVASWYHIVLAVDTTQGTNTNRVKAYVNGESYPFNNSDWPSQNDESQWGHDQRQFINVKYANNNTGDTSYLNAGYYADFCWIDGQQLAATSCGEFDEDSGIWKPIDISGLTFGSQGYWLKFDDSSDLGADSSGNSNDFTTVNLDANNQAVDTPTNNFCTLSPLWRFNSGGSSTITEGMTISTPHSSSWCGAKSTMGLSAGKWYWEWKSSGQGDYMGVQTDGEDNIYSGNPQNNQMGAFFVHDGEFKIYDADSTSGRNDVDINYPTFNSAHIFGCALDMDNNRISFYQDGTIIPDSAGGRANAPGNYDLDGLANKTVFPTASNYSYNFQWNFGGYTKFSISSAQSDANGYGNFEHAPPSGYYAICTKNLAEYGG